MSDHVNRPTIAQNVGGFIPGQTIRETFWHGLTTFQFPLVHITNPVEHVRFICRNIRRGQSRIMFFVIGNAIFIMLTILEDQRCESRRVVTVKHLDGCCVRSGIYNRQTTRFQPVCITRIKNRLKRYIFLFWLLDVRNVSPIITLSQSWCN